MAPSRRAFIKTAGGFAIASMVSSIPILARSEQRPAKDSRRQRVAVLYEPGFPEGEIRLLSQEEMRKSLLNYDVTFLNSQDLAKHLTPDAAELFINPYGSRFPKAAWNAIHGFLAAGGNWVSLGGIPFSLPADKEPQGWRTETLQTQYHKKLGITQGFPVVVNGLNFQKGTSWEGFTAEEIYELYVRFTSTRDFPSEDGSAGARDAELEGLMYGIDDAKRRMAAPFIQIDRMQGEFAGGRWILANFKGTITPPVLSSLAELALQGAIELSLRSSFACYQEGEVPSITINVRRPKGFVEQYLQNDCHLEIANERGETISKQNIRLRGEGTLATGILEAGKLASGKFLPGFYQVHASLKCTSPSTGKALEIRQSTGFWMYDEKLLKRGAPLTINTTTFLKDGTPYPVTGTTYMGSDVHRKFLFEPNPYRWHEDFRDMKKAGINMVRTGIWTGWKNYMFDVGAPEESALRAMDAFVHTARAFELPVIFTLFAFLPETWGGLNAYLDPRSVSAQKEFILSFVQRYRIVNDLLWDFINEPSFCNPKHLWECRPNYDAFESAEWVSWLKEQYPSPTEEERIAHLQEVYRTSPDDVYELPKLGEFDDVNIFNESRPLRIIDYRLFAQEMFRRWVREMAAVVKSNGNSKQLVTVGQDEGGTGESPGNQFFADAVDFTSLHNWWLNDDLVWDSTVTKVEGKPNLVEETGVMFYEKTDGSAWRTEEDARDLLERKLAIAFGAGGAGFIEWVWNTNPYMMSDNEAAIGLHRADGTAKPERAVVERYAAFFASYKEYFVGKQEIEILMIIPHSGQYSTRNFSTDATKRCVRVISHFHSMPISAVSEYKLSTIMSPPKLIFAPALRTFNEKAWQELLQLVGQGSTLLMTGVFDVDEHFLPTARGTSLGLKLSTRPVAQEEYLSINGKEYRLSYRGDKIQRIEKSIIGGISPSPEGVHQIQTLHHGKGTIIWSPLPVEVSDPPQANIDLYDLAVRTSGVAVPFTVEKVNPSILILPVIFESTVLLVFVSECERETVVNLTASESHVPLSVKLPALRTALVLFKRSDGKVIARS